MPNVGFVNVNVLYDEGAQTTIFSNSLKPFIKNYRKSVFMIDTVNGTERVEGGTGTIKVKSLEGDIPVEGIVQPLSNAYTSSHSVPIPLIWQKVYQLPSTISMSGTVYQIILGLDFLEKFPEKLISHNGLVLSVSRITGNKLVSGFNKDTTLTSISPVTKNKTSIMRTRAVKAPADENLMNHAIHPIFKENLSSIDSAFLARLTPDQDFVTKSLC